MRDRPTNVRAPGRLGLRPALVLATAMMVSSSVLGALAVFSRQRADWREQAELHRVRALAEVHAAQLIAGSSGSRSDLDARVTNAIWHPSSRLLAVLDVDGEALAVRGDRDLLRIYLERRGDSEGPAEPGGWFLPGDRPACIPDMGLAAAPLVLPGETVPSGTLVYAARAGLVPGGGSLLRPAAVLGMISCVGAFLGLCLLRYSVIEPLTALRRAGCRDHDGLKPPEGVDEIDAVARLLARLQDRIERAKARIRELEAGVDQRVQDQTHAISVQLRRVERTAWMDPLSQLGNRRLLEARLGPLLEQQRVAGGDLSLIMLDVDHFKMLNDTLGHQAGDELIRFVGELLKQCVREHDLAIRYGGDEFLLVLTATPSDASVRVAERVIRLFAQRAGLLPIAPLPGMSAGVASLRESRPLGAADLIELADRALYRAKRLGKGQVCVHAARRTAEAAR